MGIRLLLSSFCFLSAALAAEDLTKRYKGKSPEEVLRQREVAALPFSARVELLLAVAPRFKDLPPAEGMRMLRQGEDMFADSGIKPLQPFLWSQTCRACGHFFQAGRQLLTADYGPLRLAVSASEFEKYVSVAVLAILTSDATFNVDILPQNISFVQTSPKIVPFESASIRDVAKTVEHGAHWKAGLVAGFGGMATKQVTVEEQGQLNGTYRGSQGSGRFDGNYNGTSTVTVPDEQARERARNQAVEMLEQAEARSSSVTNSALMATTLAPDQKVDGFVYFKMGYLLDSGDPNL